MGSICSLNLATSVLASFFGIADSSSSTSVSQKVHRKVPKTKEVAKHWKESSRPGSIQPFEQQHFAVSLINSFSPWQSFPTHSVPGYHLSRWQRKHLDAIHRYPAGYSFSLWKAQMCCSTSTETSPNLNPSFLMHILNVSYDWAVIKSYTIYP